MGDIQYPPPVKIICAILYSESFDLNQALEQLHAMLGKTDHRSSHYDFHFTHYYDSKMKLPLKKFFISFEKLLKREELPILKKRTNEIEKKFSLVEEKKWLRCINIDPGYITGSQLILATTKNFSHRIYLNDGIYAEVTLNFKKGNFIPNPWTYPDYNTDEAISFFNEVRTIYITQLKRNSLGDYNSFN